VAMALLDRRFAEPSTGLTALVRNSAISVTVTSLPFVPHRYRRT